MNDKEPTSTSDPMTVCQLSLLEYSATRLASFYSYEARIVILEAFEISEGFERVDCFARQF